MNPPDRVREVFCKVYGNVQGVFFRRFAEEKARELGISGFAKNHEDGTVEIVAQGPEDTLKVYLASVTVGPEGAEVESAEVSWGPVEMPISGFTTT